MGEEFGCPPWLFRSQVQQGFISGAETWRSKGRKEEIAGGAMEKFLRILQQGHHAMAAGELTA
jgi:hypothetical protein